MNFQSISQTLLVWLAAFGLKILGAIALWVIGRWLIQFAIRLVTRALKKRPIEPTIINYLGSTISVLLNITLVVAIADAIQRLKDRVQAIPNVMTTPPVDVEILKFSPLGPVLAVQPYCSNQHYWQVYFDTNRIIRETFVEAGFPVPEQHLAVSNSAFFERQDGHSIAAAH